MSSVGHNNPPADWYDPAEHPPPPDLTLMGWFRVRHTGRYEMASFVNKKISNGFLMVVKGHFLFDMGMDFVKWTYAPQPPEGDWNA